MLSEIEIVHFGIHENTRIVFEPGVNLFTGDNGAGKSLVGDAIFWCLYGESLRDGRKWKPDSGAVVSIKMADGNKIVRSLRGDRTKLSLNGVETGRITEVQEEIEKLFGNAWYNKSVRFFHRSKAAKFSLATDGERKRIVENLIGVEIFDEVLNKLKTDRKKLLEDKSSVDIEESGILQGIARLEGRLESLREPEKPNTESLERIDNYIRYTEREIKTAIGQKKPEVPKGLDTAKLQVEKVKVDVSSLAREYRRLFDLGTGVCSKCGKPTDISDDTINKVAEELDNRKSDLVFFERELMKLNIGYDNALLQHDRYREMKIAADRKIAEAESEKRYVLKRLDEYNELMKVYLKQKKEIQESLDRGNDLLYRARSRGADLSRRLFRIDELMRIYGTKGARVIALSNAFDVVGKVATRVLKQLGHGKHRNAKLEIEVSSDLNKVELNVSVGDYLGSYGGLSEGEGAMFDFALLKALGSLPWRSKSSLPFVYDDVLEALDKAHKRKVCEYIEFEAEKGQTLIFTWDREIEGMFDSVKVFHVENGRIVGG